jgi:hypothetical protein
MPEIIDTNLRIDQLLTATEFADLLGYASSSASIASTERGVRNKYNMRWTKVGRQCAYLIGDAEQVAIALDSEELAQRWIEIRRQVFEDRGQMDIGYNLELGSWLTTKQAATDLRISRQHVHNLASTKGGPIKVIRFGYDYLWYRDNVEEVRRARRVGN